MRSPGAAVTSGADVLVAGIDALAERTLRENWRVGERRGIPYAFTVPATPRYRHMWHWDSCFHAIAWTRYDRTRARDELRTILRSGDPDGFLPHTVFWDSPARWRRAPLYATERTWGSWRTTSIDPPLLAWAWEKVAAASEHEAPGFAGEALDALGMHLGWLSATRDPDDEGLLTIVLPDESGLDDSPMYDEVFGPHVHYRPGYFRLVRRWGRMGWEVPRIARETDLHVKDVLVTVAYALSLRAMARLSGDAGWERRARAVERALVDRCLDPPTGLFLPLAGRDRRPVRVSTWSCLAPLALPGIPEDVRRRLVEEHLLGPSRYLAPVGIPSVAMSEPSFRPTFDRYKTWRGPSWVNTAYLLVPAMRELGYDEAADRVVVTLAYAALRSGLREYYHPLTGEGLAATGFGWSCLLAELCDDLSLGR